MIDACVGFGGDDTFTSNRSLGMGVPTLLDLVAGPRLLNAFLLDFTADAGARLSGVAVAMVTPPGAIEEASSGGRLFFRGVLNSSCWTVVVVCGNVDVAVPDPPASATGVDAHGATANRRVTAWGSHVAMSSSRRRVAASVGVSTISCTASWSCRSETWRSSTPSNSIDHVWLDHHKAPSSSLSTARMRWTSSLPSCVQVDAKAASLGSPHSNTCSAMAWTTVSHTGKQAVFTWYRSDNTFLPNAGAHQHCLYACTRAQRGPLLPYNYTHGCRDFAKRDVIH